MNCSLSTAAIFASLDLVSELARDFFRDPNVGDILEGDLAHGELPGPLHTPDHCCEAVARRHAAAARRACEVDIRLFRRLSVDAQEASDQRDAFFLRLQDR